MVRMANAVAARVQSEPPERAVKRAAKEALSCMHLPARRGGKGHDKIPIFRKNRGRLNRYWHFTPLLLSVGRMPLLLR